MPSREEPSACRFARSRSCSGAGRPRCGRGGKDALADFVVAAAGPATTALLGVLFLLWGRAGRPVLGPDFGLAFDDLGRAQPVFAVLNAIPGFPLDGGRMLMAGTWAITRNRATAQRVAGVGSMIVGGGLIAWAVLQLRQRHGRVRVLPRVHRIHDDQRGSPDPRSRGAARAAAARNGERRDAPDRRGDPGEHVAPGRDGAMAASLAAHVVPGVRGRADRGNDQPRRRHAHRGVQTGARGDVAAGHGNDHRGRRAARRRRGVDRRPASARAGRHRSHGRASSTCGTSTAGCATTGPPASSSSDRSRPFLRAPISSGQGCRHRGVPCPR